MSQEMKLSKLEILFAIISLLILIFVVRPCVMKRDMQQEYYPGSEYYEKVNNENSN